MLLNKLIKSKEDSEKKSNKSFIEKKRKKFIDAADEKPEKSWKHINLRLRADMIDKIDEIINEKRIGMNRTSWILEAIQKYIEE